MAQSIAGYIVLVALAWAIGAWSGRARAGSAAPSTRAGRASPRLVAGGLGLQIAIGLVLLTVEPARQALMGLNALVTGLQAATDAGTTMVFGYLGGGPTPFETGAPANLFILAFRGLPLILVVSALAALLFHWRVLPLIVRAFAWSLTRLLGVGGAAGLSAAANVFVGMIEAPLLVRPYLARMSRGELFMVMAVGMATIAGTMMVLYATILGPVIPGALGHILTASMMNAPAALVVAHLMLPEDRAAGGGGATVLEVSIEPAASAMDAVARGTFEGVKLLINVIAMLVVMVALVHLANQILGLLPDLSGAPVTLQRMFGLALAPFAWLLGIPWEEAATAGGLIGTKIVLNEFVAYLDLAATGAEVLSERSRLILVYALCGFANFASLGIMIGGLATMAPERRGEIAGLGARSIAAGVTATGLSAAIVGAITG